jgi:AcrR family transcriptional regulator
MPRTRSEESREAILDAALTLARNSGYGNVTMDALALAAGVGKQTIYRWWRSLGEVVLDALREYARTIPAPETGTLEGDLTAFLRATFRLVRGPEGTAPILKGLMAEAQLDDKFAPRFAELMEERREALRAIVLRHVDGSRQNEVDATVDMLFGAMWYRMLVGHRPLDAAFAQTLAVLAARQYQESREVPSG